MKPPKHFRFAKWSDASRGAWTWLRAWAKRGRDAALHLLQPSSGARAERLAANWLRRERGFAIVARNWRSPRDRREEIDLVARDREVLVFIEVKARAAAALVPGYYAVDARKKRVLRRAVRTYLGFLPPMPRAYRFDVVEVELPSTADRNARSVVRHFENVPLF